MREFSRVELAWLAGILEGEGCFYLKWRGKGAEGRELYPTLCIQLAMTDEDVVRRAAAVADIGKVRQGFGDRQFRKDGDPCKPNWIWWAGRRDGCEELMRALLPFMGERRATRIREILVAAEANPSRAEQAAAWTHGSRQGYERGCKCEKCRETHNKRMRDQRAFRKARNAATWDDEETTVAKLGVI